uniref:Crystaline entomocidal protoxin n=1 Tax=Bacillus thuringiensis TaxID=1428 RepID=A0A1C6ZWD0_BACTU|nr:insecticidal crystal protein 2 [Bacillus thuringiensis]
MNSYQNKNEYEILNASRNNSNMSNRYPRYPLANDPQASMQTTNYKDWLTMCKRTAVPSYSFSRLLNIGGSIVGYGLGMIPVAGEFLNFLLSLLWPEQSDGNDIWKELMKEVSDLIQQELTTDKINEATAALTGLREQLGIYNRSLATWLNDSTLEDLAVEIRTMMNSLHLLFAGKIIENFSIERYEKILLPSYAIAANLHLLLLRDIEIHGKKLGFNQESLKYYNCELKYYTAQHTKYCLDTYNKGLASEKEKSWLHFHRYRREMTLAVLDIIALFPLYDARLYPSKDSTLQVKSELTREIYSDVVNADVFGTIYTDNNRNEELYTRPPHLFTWLRGFRFVTNSISSGSRTWTFLAGNQNKYSYTRDNRIIYGPFYGQDTNYGGTSSDTDFAEDSYVYNLWTKNYEFISPYTDPVNITKINFSVTNNNSSKDETYGGERNLPTVQTNFDFLTNKVGNGSPTYNNYNHILSYMLTNGTFSQKRHGYTFAFTHSSVDPYNTIAPDKITQIPAVKAYELSTRGTRAPSVIAGPGDTGGDIVRLPYFGRLRIRLAPETTYKNYLVRIRYTSGGVGKLLVERWSPSSVINNTFDVPMTGYYGPYAYLDTLVTTFYQSDVQIIIENQGGFDFDVDKIELIPSDIPIEKCTKCQYVGQICTCSCPALQSLDTEKEIVNSLFVE